MTDELDPQTQQHIDDSAGVAADTDAATCNDTDVDDATLDNGAATEIPAAEDAGEQNDDSAAQDDAPEKDAAPQAEGPIEVSSEEELDAVMDSMMDAVKAMKDAVSDADIDAEEEEAAEAASTFVPGETPVADQGSTMPSFLQLEHPTIGADAVDPHAAGFSVIEGGTGNIAAPQTTDVDAADTGRPIASHAPAASRDLGTAVSNTANAVGAFIAQGASAMREMNAAKKALADARDHLAELEQRIADQSEELETRQDIAGRYDQIVAEQRQAIDTAQKAAAAAEIGRDKHAAKATELKAQLEQIKEEDDATERRLKAALDAVEAREASSRENILKAKCEIFENLKKDGLAVLNGDDKLLNTVSLPQKTLRCGPSEHCDVRVSEVEDLGIDGIRCVVTTAKERYALSIPVPGKHMVYSAAMAAAIGEYLGETKEEIERGVAAYEPAGSRMHVITFSENRRLLDDCYNAGPQSMAASLRVLGASGGKKAAVIGDMAELGELTERAHKEIGELTKELGIDTVIAIGARAKYFTEGNPSAQWFGSVDEAMGAVKAAFTAETAMLVKASHSMHFEKIVEELTKA